MIARALFAMARTERIWYLAGEFARHDDSARVEPWRVDQLDASVIS